MANLQVKDINDRLYKALKHRAILEHRSVSQEVVQMIETCLSLPASRAINATRAFLELSGSWGDDRDAETIIKSIREGRRNSRRFGKSPDVFN